jgi:hypothetical protein
MPFVLTNSALNIGAGGTAAASFTVRDSTAFSGNIGAGQTIWVQGSDGPGPATLTYLAQLVVPA